MKLFSRSLFFLLALPYIALYGSFAVANAVVSTPPIPAWVKPVATPNNTQLAPEKIQNGVYYLLVDAQIRVRAKQEPEYFFHASEEIINQTGVENSSQLNIDYDPHYQSLHLHQLQIIRDGKVLDKTSSARMAILAREEDMQQLIYNGSKTLNIILDDVRVGDRLEYAYSRVGMNPVYQGIFASSLPLNWSVPVAKVSRRLLWDKPNPVYARLKNTDLSLRVNRLDVGTEYWVIAENQAAFKLEDNTPNWFDPWARLQFSETKQWDEIVDWGLPLYRDAKQSSAAIKTLVGQIRAQHSTPKAQVFAALDFVQNEVRYLGIELGLNSHQPHSASETMDKRYGDCKDKTVLLLTLLDELGIQASAALVNSDKRLESNWPNIRAFDHVIAYVELGAQFYWLDPTRTYQHGGLDQIYQADYDQALVLKPGSTRLVNMHPSLAKTGRYIKDQFDINDDGAQALFTSTTQDYGLDAEISRRRFASKGSDKIQDEYLNFYRDYYASIETQAALNFKPLGAANAVQVEEYYRIKELWQDKPEKERFTADFYANLISPMLDAPPQIRRTQPYALQYPRVYEQTIALNFSSDDWDFEDEKKLEDNPFFEFSYQAHFDKEKRQLSLSYRYKSKVDHVTADDFTAYLAALERVASYRGYSVFKYYANTDQAKAEQTTDGDTSIAAGFSNSSLFILVYILLYLFVLMLWRFERWGDEKKADQEAIYFPVSMAKLLPMWLLTFGLYGAFWFYKNFSYLKLKNKTSSMPWARGLFNIFWYYPLWKQLHTEQYEYQSSARLPSKAAAMALALMFVMTGLASSNSVGLELGLLLSALLVLPLVNYIEQLNGSDNKAYKINSAWRWRHYLLLCLSVPLLSYPLLSYVGVVPSDSVVKGERVLKHDIKRFIRLGLLQPGDQLDYFYSDAWLFIGDDGNGFTQRHVFSYWRDEDETRQQEQAEYSQISDIRVEWGKPSTGADTIITLEKNNQDTFILFVATEGKKDKVFVKTLKERWRSANALAKAEH